MGIVQPVPEEDLMHRGRVCTPCENLRPVYVALEALPAPERDEMRRHILVAAQKVRMISRRLREIDKDWMAWLLQNFGPRVDDENL